MDIGAGLIPAPVQIGDKRSRQEYRLPGTPRAKQRLTNELQLDVHIPDMGAVISIQSDSCYELFRLHSYAFDTSVRDFIYNKAVIANNN